MNDLLGPLLRMLARTPSYKLKLSKGICKQVLEERNEWTRDSLPASTSGMSVRCAVFKEGIHAAILEGSSMDVSFDNFPYYLRYSLYALFTIMLVHVSWLSKLTYLLICYKFASGVHVSCKCTW